MVVFHYVCCGRLVCRCVHNSSFYICPLLYSLHFRSPVYTRPDLFRAYLAVCESLLSINSFLIQIRDESNVT